MYISNPMLMPVSSALVAEIGEVANARKKNWWEALVEGDAKVLPDHYQKLPSLMNSFIVRKVIHTFWTLLIEYC